MDKIQELEVLKEEYYRKLGDKPLTFCNRWLIANSGLDKAIVEKYIKEMWRRPTAKEFNNSISHHNPLMQVKTYDEESTKDQLKEIYKLDLGKESSELAKLIVYHSKRSLELAVKEDKVMPMFNAMHLVKQLSELGINPTDKNIEEMSPFELEEHIEKAKKLQKNNNIHPAINLIDLDVEVKNDND